MVPARRKGGFHFCILDVDSIHVVWRWPPIYMCCRLSGCDWSGEDIKMNLVQVAIEHAENITMETALASSRWRLNVCLYCKKANPGITTACEMCLLIRHEPCIFQRTQHTSLYTAAPEAFAFSCASSFLRAARIISSLRRCRFACLSVLSVLQAFDFGCSSCAGCDASEIFADRLYLVIRSGCEGRAGVAAGRTGAGEARGPGIWKDGGA